MSKYRTRDPQVTNRDPVIDALLKKHKENVSGEGCAPPKQERKPRRYISAAMPTVCPDCGHNTRMDDGRHVDPVRQKILEYRTCAKCNAKLAAGRDMTPAEKARLCSRAEAVAEYEQMQEAVR